MQIKVGYILSYKSPNYVRTEVLLDALHNLADVKTFIAKNTVKNFLRYFQTTLRLIKLRILHQPEIYILGFRGHEFYWIARLLTWPKPLIFDEFINSDDWLTNENKRMYIPSWFLRIIKKVSRSILNNANLILTDTRLDAQSSSLSHSINLSKYRVIYVGADEKVFTPKKSSRKQHSKLEVFFYGNMAPLHGLNFILSAINKCKGLPAHFTIVGGKGNNNTINLINSYINKHSLKNVTYYEWMKYEKIADAMKRADVTLGGPFGATSQSMRVITGKTFQSLAVGTPVIIGQISEDVGFKNLENCLLINQGSDDEIKKAVEWCVKHKENLNLIGNRGRKLYQKKFSTKQIATELDKILRSIK